MAIDILQAPLLPQSEILSDEISLVGVSPDGTNRISSYDLVQAMPNFSSSALPYKTYAELAAVTGTAGEGAQVIDSDTGTHTDPVVGGTVSNAGIFIYRTSPAGWERIGDTLAKTAGDAAVSAQNDAATVAADKAIVVAAKADAETAEANAELAETGAEAARDIALAGVIAAANYHVSKAAGEAATVAGDFFSYPDGAGGLIYAERTADGAGDAGGNSQQIAEVATKSQIDAKANIVDLETQQVIGDTNTRTIPTDLAGGTLLATSTHIFIGLDPPSPSSHSADGLTIDASRLNPPGHATRCYAGLSTDPQPVIAGSQIGYWDFRAYNKDAFGVGKFYNVASIDVKVFSGVAFGPGDAPPVGMHFYITGNNDQAKEALRLIPHGGDDGFGGYFGFIEADGETTNLPPGGMKPRLMAASRLNDWTAFINSRPASGVNYGLRIDTLSDTLADFPLAIYGAGSLLGSWRGDGTIIPSKVRVGTTGNPAFGDPKLHVLSDQSDWAVSAYSAPSGGGAGYAARYHTVDETSASYIFGGSSGAGAGSFKFSVRGNGDVHATGDLNIGGSIGTGSYTVATVPSAASGAGKSIYVSDESGGATPAFSDGTNWRRYADRAIIS